MAIIASDTFIRPDNALSWVTSSGGQVWNHAKGTMKTAIVSNTGALQNHDGADYNVMLLGSLVQADTEILVKITMGNPADAIGVVLRSDTGGNNCSIGRLQPHATSTTNIQIGRMVGSSFTLVGTWSMGFTAKTGTVIWLRGNASGPVVSLKCWLDGSSEPSDWQGIVTDFTYASGRFGIYSGPDADTGYHIQNITVSNTISSFGSTRIAVGRFVLAIAGKRTRSFVGRVSLRVGKQRTAMGRFTLRQPLGPGVSVYVGNNLITPYENDQIVVDDKVNARATASFTVIGPIAAQLNQNSKTEIWDSVRGILFAGSIESITLNKVINNNVYLWKISCRDNRFCADKRIYTGPELNNFVAGDAVALMHQKVLVDEGVTANYALRVDNDASSFSQGTNTNLDTDFQGDLEIAPSGGSFVIAEDSQAAFAAGTLVNTAAVNATLQLASSSAIKMSGTPQAGKSTDIMVAFTFWKGTVTVAAGDYFEYEIWNPSTNPQKKGGIDLVESAGDTLRNDILIFDQNGLDQDPQTDISAYSTDKWYKRHIVMPSSWTGKSVKQALIILDGDAAGDYTIYCRHIKYYSSAGVLKATFYESGPLTTNTINKNVGYKTYAVTTATVYEQMGTRVAPAHTNSTCPLMVTSFVDWQLIAAAQPSSSTSYPDQLVVEASYDGGATWLVLINSAPVPTLQAGANLSGTSWLIRYTLNIGGPSPEFTPIVNYLFLVLAPTASATVGVITDIDKTGDGSFAAGALTNTQNATNGLRLTNILSDQWNNADMSNMTTVGSGGSPVTTPWFGGIAIVTDSLTDGRARLDFVPNVADGTIEVDVQMSESLGNVGPMYRTTYWGTEGINVGGYMVKMSPASVEFGHGSNSSANSWTSLVTYTKAFTTGTWYRIKVVFNGTSHKISINDTEVISTTDSFKTTSGAVGLRYSNHAGVRASGYFDNFGIISANVTLPFTGTRVHTGVALTGIVGHSRIFWNALVPSNTNLLIEASLDAGVTYLPCTNGGVVPGCETGVNVTGKTLLIRETLTTSNVNTSPLLTGIHVAIYGAYVATGTRVSPVLPIGAIGRVGSTSFTWDALTPLSTSVLAETSLDNVTYTPIVNPGDPVAGIMGQPDQMAEGFSTDNTSQWSGSYYGAGSIATPTWDLVHSRLSLAGGSGAIYYWASGPASFKDGSITAIVTQSDQGALVLRYSNNSNFYRVIVRDATASATTLQVVRRVAGTETTVGTSGTLSFVRGTPHVVNFSIVGTLVTVTWDGVIALTFTDGSPLNIPGQVGFFQTGLPGTPSIWQKFYAQALGDNVGQISYNDTVIANGPMARYRLNESSGVLAHDLTSNHYDGTIASGVTPGQPGALTTSGDLDTAMLFDGTSGTIALPVGLTVGGLTAFSAELWFNFSNITFSNFPRAIADGFTGTANKGFEIEMSSPGITFDVGNGTTRVRPFYSTTFAAGVWYHVVGTYDGANARLYVNGVLQATIAMAGALQAGVGPITIGNIPGGTNWFPGLIDEVALYNATLSAGQIATLYTNGTTTGGKNMYYRLTLTSTDPAATPKVRSAVLSARGPQIMTGALLPTTAYQYKNVASNIDDAAKRSNYWWTIADNQKALIFQNRSAQPAPWAVSSIIKADGTSDLQMAPLPTVVYQIASYRNRQYITGGYDNIDIVEEKIGDGTVTSWSLSSKIQSINSILINGDSRTFGIQGQDTGRDFYYTPGDPTLSQDQSASPLTKQQTASISFVGQTPYTAMAEDTNQQAIISAYDSTSGIVETSEDAPGLNRAAADALAQARITQYAKLARDWAFTTYRSGLLSGQMLSVFVPEFNLNDVDFLITGIKTTIHSDGAGGNRQVFGVSCSEGPILGSWARIFVLQ